LGNLDQVGCCQVGDVLCASLALDDEESDQDEEKKEDYIDQHDVEEALGLGIH